MPAKPPFKLLLDGKFHVPRFWELLLGKGQKRRSFDFSLPDAAPNRWRIYQRLNPREMEVSFSDSFWKQREKERAKGETLLEVLNESKKLFDFKYQPAENDLLLLKMEQVVFAFVYQEGEWQGYDPEEMISWEYWLKGRGDIKAKIRPQG